MTDSLPTLQNGTKLKPSDEIYTRNSAGRFGGRLGVVADLVPSLGCYQERIVEKRDDAHIIEAMKRMLEGERLLDLKLSYEAIVNSFQTYVEHGQEHAIVRTQQLCTEAAPGFRDAFEKALTAVNPHSFRFFDEAQVRRRLTPLITAADAYLVVLSIGFHSQTVLTPSTALNDSVILSQIKAAIQLLRSTLSYTLIPGNMVSRSAMAALLLRGSEHWFLHYYPHCEGYEGPEGIVRMVADASELKAEKWQGYRASDDYPYAHNLDVADILLELIARFDALLNIRLNFQPGAKQLPDPTTISSLSGGDTPALAVEGMGK